MSGLFGGGQKATTHATKAMGIDFQGAQYGPPVPVVYGQNKVPGNCIWYGDFRAQAQQQKSGKGGGGGSTTNYTYSASAQMGLCEGPGIALVNVYDGNSVVNLSSINYAFASGAKGQAAWSHLSGNAALGYSLTALFSFQNLALGSQASLPNYNYEVKALKPFSGSIVDANPSDILSDICSDPYHGVNFPYLGSLTQYSNYCVANSLFLSPVYDQQQTANQTLTDLFKYTNTYVYYSEDQLKVVPLGDVAVTGNGVTFTPNVTPVVDLDDTDFLVGSGDPAVTFDRVAPQNALNLVRVEFTDRSNTYHDSGVVGSIDFDVVANGERSDTSETVNGCTTAAVARFIAQNLVQRAFYIRNTYQFKLPWNYCYLEPTDIVTLTDASLGLNKFPVRITSVEEDGGSVLTIEAEEFPEGIGHSSIYGTQANGGTNVDQNADPGPVNPPYLFRGPGMLVSNNTPEIWCACNGSGDLWGACEVYLSHDGSSYTYTGTIASQARYGALTSSLPVGSADPDTTNQPTVNLYAPAQLLGGSQTDADNFVTLAMVDTEIIGYETAALQSANTYKLTYLRRGGYGSTNVAHSSGAPFVRLDDSIFRIPVDPSLIGSTVYLKFLSLNVFGRGPRTLAEETAYTYVVGTNVELPDVPNVPDTFAVLAVADGVNITWTNDNPAAVGCTSIEYATASGGPWTVLAQVGPTTTAYTHHFTNGATYYYRGRARGPLLQSGWSGYTSVINSTGVNISANVAAALTAANNAQSAANTANAQLADIASDNILSPAEKPTVIRDYSVITTEQAGIDAQATAYGVTTEKTAYDNAVSALTTYLNGLTSPTAWNNKSGNTTIVGTTFRANFNTVYTTRQTLLNAIYAAAQTLANNAQGTANTANANTPNVINPNFADGATGWTMQQGWIEFDGHAQYTGYAGAVNNALYNTRLVPVAPGQQITVQATLHAFSAAGTCGACVAWFDANSNWLAFSSRGTSITGTATAISRAVAVAPASAAYAAAAVDVWSGISGSFTADDFILTPTLATVDELPDGGTYGRTINTYLNANRPVTNFADTFHPNKNLGYVADGGGRYGVHAVDGNNLALIDFSQAGHVKKTMDYIGDSATRFAAAQAGADKTASNPQASTWLDDSVNLARGGDSMTRFGDRIADNIGETSARKWAAQSGADITTNYAAAGDNMLANPGFESNNVGAIDGDVVAVGGHISDGWTLSGASLTETFWYSGAGRTGGRGILLRAAPGSVLPAGAGYVAYARAISAPIQCSPGDVISFGGYSTQGNSDPGGTFGIISRIGLYTADASGSLTEVANQQDVLTAAGWALRGPYNYVVPAGVSKVYLQCAFFAENTGASDATVQGLSIFSEFDDLFVTRNDLRAPGSGVTVGDQRNLLPVTWAGLRSVLSTSPITFTITSGSPNSTVHFAIAAFSLVGGGVTINYNASSATIAQANGTTTTWYLFFHDPTQSGGSLTPVVTTSPTISASYADSMNIGNATVTVASGGGGAPGAGSGGGGYCVADDMFIGEGRRAGDAEIGDPFDCIDLPTAAGKHQRALQGVTRGTEECVRMITSDGCALVCSVSTPFDLPDGRSTTAPHMLGEQVITDLGTATVISLALVGPRSVTRAHLGGVSYAAGADPARRIYSHNTGTVKP